MRTYKKELEYIANDILNQNASEDGAEKPNYSNRDFLNTILIFQTALMDKLLTIKSTTIWILRTEKIW